MVRLPQPFAAGSSAKLHVNPPLVLSQAPSAFPTTMCPELAGKHQRWIRSEEHTSELQSHLNLVCRLLLEKKKIFLCSCATTEAMLRLRDPPRTEGTMQ